MNHRIAFIAGLCAIVTASGCYTTRIHNGAAQAESASMEYDEKWHSGFINGIVEVSGPYDLAKVCPNGWAEIKTETTFLNGVVNAITSPIYNPQSVTVRCAAGEAAPKTTSEPSE